MGYPKIVSLFCGAGGLDLGFDRSGFQIAFATDISEAAIASHSSNFKSVKTLAADMLELGTEGVADQLKDVLADGESIGIIGGPPCQGFSRANSQSFAGDPRNQLPLRYLDVVEALQKRYNVMFVLFENVLGILDEKHSDIYQDILARFSKLGLKQVVKKYCALDYGVPQNRRRVIISAFSSPELASMFERNLPEPTPHEKLTVRQAIGALPDPVFFKRGLRPEEIPYHQNHWAMQPRSKRFANPDSYQTNSGRCFRRLEWDLPSPTVAYGHREMHVHPNGTRRISILEAMLLQGFDESFVLKGTFSEQVTQVSNAVPPPLSEALAKAVARALEETG